jgi:hypothetical protein
MELTINEKIKILQSRLDFWKNSLNEMQSFNKQISESGNLLKINMNNKKMENARNIIDFLEQEMISLQNSLL